MGIARFRCAFVPLCESPPFFFLSSFSRIPMYAFTDRLGRPWRLDLNYQEVRRLTAAVGVNLLKVLDPGDATLERLTGDIEFLVDLLWAIVAPQAAAAGVTDEDFGRALSGEILDEAADALVLEIAGFFRRRQRELLLKMWGRIEQIADLVGEEAAKRLDSPEIEARVQATIQAAFDAAWSPPATTKPNSAPAFLPTGSSGTAPASSG